MVEKLIKEFPYYSRVEIPVAHYPKVENRKDLASFGVLATLCTSTSVDEEIVYELVKQTFENLAELKSLHPALGGLSPEQMLLGLNEQKNIENIIEYIEIFSEAKQQINKAFIPQLPLELVVVEWCDDFRRPF